ncbi:uncharacterized protein LOC133918654 [Phragmites australis]|uniref:uncharacterized protein LOC133918654 n=1 Tax=Phragmites australis TaxID=29695 RepID=UPI002D76E79A|nr:uncharacterized protein LOC133918654 [Phragmites australis]XP_062218611.1 uncharacterized protein LOC133918654 [Phragmites australis]
MPMERSVSCVESTTYGGVAAADLRCYSSSYAPRVPSNKVKRARSTGSWSRPVPGAVQRSGSVKSFAAPGLNLRSYSASYGPTADGASAGGQLKRSGSITNWSSASRRSVNLRAYTPSFSTLDSTATVAPAPAPAKKASDDAELKRKKRLVVYKVYGVEGKVRDSVRRGVSWIKGKCSRLVYGWW